jgi:hypothetical protein
MGPKDAYDQIVRDCIENLRSKNVRDIDKYEEVNSLSLENEEYVKNTLQVIYGKTMDSEQRRAVSKELWAKLNSPSLYLSEVNDGPLMMALCLIYWATIVYIDPVRERKSWSITDILHADPLKTAYIFDNQEILQVLDYDPLPAAEAGAPAAPEEKKLAAGNGGTGWTRVEKRAQKKAQIKKLPKDPNQSKLPLPVAPQEHKAPVKGGTPKELTAEKLKELKQQALEERRRKQQKAGVDPSGLPLDKHKHGDKPPVMPKGPGAKTEAVVKKDLSYKDVAKRRPPATPEPQQDKA